MNWTECVERRILQARDEGLFDDLPAAGKPLRLEDDSLVDPEWRLTFHLLRGAGLAPEWIMLDREIREQLRVARAEFDRRVAPLGDAKAGPVWDRAVAALDCRIREINAQIDRLNLLAPLSSLRRASLDLQKLIRLETLSSRWE